MVEFKEQFIGDPSRVVQELDDMVFNSQSGYGRVGMQLYKLTFLRRNIPPTSPKEITDSAMTAAVVASVNDVKNEQARGYEEMVYQSLKRIVGPNPSDEMEALQVKGLRGAPQVDEYLFSLAVDQVVRPLSKSLKKRGAKIGARQLTSGITLVSFGTEETMVREFDTFSPVMKDTVDVFQTVFNPQKQLEGTLVLWNDPGVRGVIPLTKNSGGLHDFFTDISILYYNQPGASIPRLARSIRPRAAAHEIIHGLRGKEQEYLGNFVEEGLIQLMAYLVSGENYEKLGHRHVSNSDIDIKKVQEVIARRNRKPDQADKNVYNFEQNYRVALSFFTALFTLVDPSERLPKLGQFINSLNEDSDVAAALEDTYRIDLNRFQTHWKESAEVGLRRFPRLIKVELDTNKVTPFGRKEIAENLAR